jgi:hypothetical protein
MWFKILQVIWLHGDFLLGGPVTEQKIILVNNWKAKWGQFFKKKI